MIHHDALTHERKEHDLEPHFEFTAHEEVYIVEPKISTANVPVSTVGAKLGHEEALRLQEQLDKDERQRLARVHEEASTFNAEEWDNIKAQIEADEELAQRLQAEERGRYSNADKARLLQLKKLSFDEIKDLFESTMKRVKDFVPMKSDKSAPKIAVGSSKRDAEKELNQESSKRQKTGEGSEPSKE
ncbi:hypothetical protein Tco_0986238 [Tanacetum coccineum]